MPKQQKRRVRSNCWYFYSKTVDGGLCNMCKKEVRSTGNTTNLLNHLKRRHTQQYSEVLANPEKYAVICDDDSHSEHEGELCDNKHNEAIATAKEIETGQPHSMETFHGDQGGTVIWLQPTVDQQPNAFQPQITIVQHSMQDNSDGQQEEGETILGTGEIVSTSNLPTIEECATTIEEHKTSTDNHRMNHRKSLLQNSSGKTVTRVLSRTQAKSLLNSSPVKVVNESQDVANYVNREDTYDTFGKYVASLLRNLPSKKAACKLQKDIIWLVLQEQMRNEDC